MQDADTAAQEMTTIDGPDDDAQARIVPDRDAEQAEPQTEVPAGRRPGAPGPLTQPRHRGQPDKDPGFPEAGRAPPPAQHIEGVAEDAVLVVLGGLDRSSSNRLHPGLDRPDERVCEGPPDRGADPVGRGGAVGQDPDDRTRRVLAVPAAPAADQPERLVEYRRPGQPRRHDQTVRPRVVRLLGAGGTGRDHHHAGPATGRRRHRPGRRHGGGTRIDEDQPQNIGSRR